jgi:hypothetical protein
MRGPVKGSLLENLVQDSKIPEVERRKPPFLGQLYLGKGSQREWVVRKMLPTSLLPAFAP